MTIQKYSRNFKRNTYLTKKIMLDKLKRKANLTITKKMRRLVWEKDMFNNMYERKCYIRHCNNKININTCEIGHDIPRSKGGSNHLSNLFAICRECNLDMGNRYSIAEYDKISKYKRKNKKNLFRKFFLYFCKSENI